MRLRTIDGLNTDFAVGLPFEGVFFSFWSMDLGFRILGASRKGQTVVVWAVEE